MLLRQGRLSKWFSGIGQEAIAVGRRGGARADDYDPADAPQPRRVHGARASTSPRLFRQLLGKDGGFTKGRDRTFHFGTLEHRIVGMISHLGRDAAGGRRPGAGGAAARREARGGGLHRRRRHERRRLPRGAEPGRGVEAAGALRDREQPVRACRPRSTSSTPAATSPTAASATACRAWWSTATTCWRWCARCATPPTARARGDGPTLLEFKTFRMRGHEEASGTDYVPQRAVRGVGAARTRWCASSASLDERGVLTPGERDALRADAQGRDRRAGGRRRSPRPSPTRPPEQELADVYAPSRLRVRASAARSRGDGAPSVRYVDAITRRPARGACGAIRRVVLIGQDIAEYGGVFKVTEGFVEEFGKARVRNTPIIESGAIGAALGLALDGFVPMVEMQFGDFITCGFNQIVNNLAKTHYRWGAARAGRDPRARSAAASAPGPFHSQNVEAWFTHVAGLKVVAPATPVRRQGPAARRVRGRQPGALPRAQAALPLGAGARCRRATTRCRSARRASRATGRRRHRRHLRRRRRLGARGRGRRSRAEGREIEVVDLRIAPAVGRRDACVRVGAEDRARAGPARGAAHRRLRRRGRRDASAERRSSGSTRRSRGSARSTRRSRSPRRSRTSSRRRAACCRRCASSWPTELAR